jgi:hypothetical protein
LSLDFLRPLTTTEKRRERFKPGAIFDCRYSLIANCLEELCNFLEKLLQDAAILSCV